MVYFKLKSNMQTISKLCLKFRQVKRFGLVTFGSTGHWFFKKKKKNYTSHVGTLDSIDEDSNC